MLDAVVSGLTNAPIGRQPFVSETTVKTHVTRVLAKLGLETGSRRSSTPTSTACAADGSWITGHPGPLQPARTTLGCMPPALLDSAVAMPGIGPSRSSSQRGARIVVTGLTKRHGSLTAVDDLSFTVEPGRLLPRPARPCDRRGPALVDWVDYAARNRAASPQTFATDASTGTSGRIWLVRGDGHLTYGDQCRRLDEDLASLRPRRVEVQDADAQGRGLWLIRYLPATSGAAG